MLSNDPLRPPRERGMPRALLLAALMHVLLIALLAFGVHWRSHQPEAVEAELWAPTAHLAAPPAPKPAPQPTPTPQPEPQPAPPPPPPPRVQPQPTPDEAQIALQRKKKLEAKRKAQEQQAELEAQKKLDAQKKLEAEQKLEAQNKLKAEKKLKAQKKLEAQKELAAEKKLEAQKKLEAEKKLEAKKLAEQKKQAQQLAREQKAARTAYLQSMMAQAGDGAPGSTGTAARTSGPSGGYGARLATLVRQNVVYPQLAQVQGNPQVLLSVTLDPNTGEVVGVHVKRSSGVPSWDAAVVRAVQRLGRFPSDHGHWYTPMDVLAGPRDTH